MPGTVISQLTTVTLAEAADDSFWDDIGGGPGSSQSDELPIQGIGSRARRIDGNVRGFSFDNTSSINLSATGTHIGWWVNVLQVGLINPNGIEFLIGDAANPKSGNWSGFFFDETQYPVEGGWIRVWLDITRTRNTGAGTLNLANVRQFGVEFDIGNVGGNAPNCLLDRIDYSTGGLLIRNGTAGSPATFADLSTSDTNTSNAFGVVRPQNGVNFILARVTIGDANATVFSDTGFANIFADQRLCASDFMGVTVDLQNGGTDVDFVNGLLRSGGSVNRGDFIVSGTAGTFDARSSTFDNLRILTLNASCDFIGCQISNSGQATLNGASFLSGSVTNSTAASALLWNTAENTLGKLDDTVFTSSGSGHAIEFTNSLSEITLSGVGFNDYAVTNGSTGNEAIYNNTGGLITINIVEGGDTPSVRNGVGASTVINNPQTLTISRIQPSSEVRIYDANDTSIELAGTESLDGGLISVEISNPGSGYSVNDVLTLVGGTFSSVGRARVTSVGGGGEILTVEVDTEGSYSQAPSAPYLTTGGTGSGATLTGDILGSFSYSYNYSSDLPIVVVVASLDFNILRLVGQSLLNTSQTIPIQQIGDRVYLNP